MSSKGEIMKQYFIAYTMSILAISLSITSNATILVSGPSTTSGLTFDSYASQKVYSPGSATLYVGLEEADSGSSIYRVQRPIGTASPSFTAVGSIAYGITNLTLATNLGNATPYVAFTDNNSSTEIQALTYDGSTISTPATLNDAAGDTTENIFTIAGMLLPDSTTQGYIFAAVSPSTTTTFGELNSGIAVVKLTNASSLTLDQTAADTSTPTTIKAKELDPETEQVYIVEPPIIDNFATMHWDGKLQRLYTGLELTTSAGAGNGAKAVVVAQVTDSGALELQDIVPDAALTAGEVRAVVAAINDVSGDATSIAIIHLKTMHCSTGPSYLIVNGGVGTSSEVNNVIYALPLVQTCAESAIQGTLAKADSALSYKNTFVQPALVTADLALAETQHVQVGAGPLPIQATTAISDIEVVGDTVYVSIATGQTATDDNGIFYSQALFDKTGKIARWTPWTKRAFPFNAFNASSVVNEGVRFFAVDAVTGKVWAVDGATQKVVRVTSWDKGATCTSSTDICKSVYTSCNQATSRCCNCSNCQSPYIATEVCCNLPAQVCASLSCGCYSVLDLDQSTRGFTAAEGNPVTLNRFALFGGCGIVDIARVSVAYSSTLISPQIVIEDFCSSCSCNNFLETVLPDRNVCVNVLEYSRTTSNYQCYFFAGTDNGLYTYAFINSTTGGFPLDGLDLDILAHGKWIKISAFPDPIVDIKTTGLSLYIVSRSVKNGTMKSTVSRVDFKETVSEMFSQTYTLAQSGITPFENCPAFTGIQPVAVTTEGTPETIAAEELFLATNYGLFGSYAITTLGAHGIASAIDQTEANWALVPPKNTIWLEGIAGIDTPIPSTVWPISVEDICGSLSYENSWIFQISSIATDPTGSGLLYEHQHLSILTLLPISGQMAPADSSLSIANKILLPAID